MPTLCKISSEYYIGCVSSEYRINLWYSAYYNTARNTYAYTPEYGCHHRTSLQINIDGEDDTVSAIISAINIFIDNAHYEGYECKYCDMNLDEYLNRIFILDIK